MVFLLGAVLLLAMLVTVAYCLSRRLWAAMAGWLLAALVWGGANFLLLVFVSFGGAATRPDSQVLPFIVGYALFELAAFTILWKSVRD